MNNNGVVLSCVRSNLLKKLNSRPNDKFLNKKVIKVSRKVIKLIEKLNQKIADEYND